MKIGKVILLKDKMKDVIHNKFNDLIQTSEQNEKEKRANLAVFVRWIGFDVTSTDVLGKVTKKIHRRGSKILKSAASVEYEINIKMPYKLDHYGITCAGEPVCVEAYCTKLAS